MRSVMSIERSGMRVEERSFGFARSIAATQNATFETGVMRGVRRRR